MWEKSQGEKSNEYSYTAATYVFINSICYSTVRYLQSSLCITSNVARTVDGALTRLLSGTGGTDTEPSINVNDEQVVVIYNGAVKKVGMDIYTFVYILFL